MFVSVAKYCDLLQCITIIIKIRININMHNTIHQVQKSMSTRALWTVLSALLLTEFRVRAFSNQPFSPPRPYRFRSGSSEPSLIPRLRCPFVANSRKLRARGFKMSTASSLKVRSVTSFISLSKDMMMKKERLSSLMGSAVRNNAKMQTVLEGKGLEIQTTRIATNSFEEWLSLDDDKAFNTELDLLSKVLKDHGIQFCSIGPAKTPGGLSRIPGILNRDPAINSSCDLLPSRDLTQADLQWFRAVADCCLQISNDSEGGAANFRFCASANISPGIPFFPAAYHGSASPPSFAIALENGGLAFSAFHAAAGGQIEDGLRGLRAAMEEVCQGIEAEARAVAEETGFEYLGIDTSLNPALCDGGSIVYACEGLMGERFTFGGAGTMALCEGITRTMKRVQVRQIGFCGLMLPVLEDSGLAKRVTDGSLSVGSLLSFSAVCGVGLDTVPVEGGVSPDALARVYADVSAMAHRLNKPLSCRLFPVPGVAAGALADFPDNPYLCSSAALPVP